MKVSPEEKGKWAALLKSVRFFAKFSDEDLSSMLDIGEVKRVNLHEYVIREQDPSDDHSFYVILKGAVKVIKKSVNLGRKDILVIQAGDCFGEMAFLLDSKRSASVLAVEDCYIFKINAIAAKLLDQSVQVKLYQQFAVSLAERLKSLTEEVICPY
jgi:CRP-like cAMP-binding protein